MHNPTPPVYSLVISFDDLPPGLFEQIAETPGIVQVKGDHTGIIPIIGAPTLNAADQTVTLVFFDPNTGAGAPLPDDRFTLTILDELRDLAGNRLDGESNVSEPQELPTFPSGDGIAGGDFVARFTVDSRPEIGVYCAATVWIDINGNLVWDPQGQNDDTRTSTCHSPGHRPGTGRHDAANGNPRHRVRGQLSTEHRRGTHRRWLRQARRLRRQYSVGSFRWLVDVNNDGVVNPADGDIGRRQPSVPGFAINGLPVAGDFDGDGDPTNGDIVGIFNGIQWAFDRDKKRHHQCRWQRPVHQQPHPRRAIVGDFDGDGLFDLATWKNDVFYFDLAHNGFGHQDATINFGFPGLGESPLAADMDADGVTDIGLWVPPRSGVTPPEGIARFNFLFVRRPT